MTKVDMFKIGLGNLGCFTCWKYARRKMIKKKAWNLDEYRAYQT